MIKSEKVGMQRPYLACIDPTLDSDIPVIHRLHMNAVHHPSLIHNGPCRQTITELEFRMRLWVGDVTFQGDRYELSLLPLSFFLG